MTRKLTPKQLEKVQDKLIEQIYYAHCSGMQINVLRIPALFTMARKLLTIGANETVIAAAMIAFVKEGAS